MTESLDHAHVERLLSWALRGREFTAVPDGDRIRVVVPSAFRDDALSALETAGYGLVRQTAVAHVVLYTPPATVAESCGSGLKVTCTLCGGVHTVPDAVDGALVDCAFCPWQGTVVNSDEHPHFPPLS